MTISRVQVFSIPVSDQDRARDFYVGALGMRVLSDSALGPDMRWLQLGFDGADTAVTLVTWFPSMPAGSLKGIVLETDDLEGDVAALEAKGVAIDGTIQDAPWGRFVTLDDPDGNGIVLQATASWQR
jgi:catechol 2,3-dioxygenase-like lactoylglutathione lyase family enzyme